MLEHQIDLGIRIASLKFTNATTNRNPENIMLAAQQIVALQELDQARKDIFAKHNVPDITLEEESRWLNFAELDPKLFTGKKFGEILQIFRKGEDLSISELARKSHIARPSLYGLEGNKTRPTKKTLEKLISGFGWKPDDNRAQFLERVWHENNSAPKVLRPNRA